MKELARRQDVVETALYGPDGLQVQVTKALTILEAIPKRLDTMQTEIHALRSSPACPAPAPITVNVESDGFWSKVGEFAGKVIYIPLAAAGGWMVRHFWH
jgi:hypothetical protein